MTEFAKAAFVKAQETYGSAITGLKDVKWEQLPPKAVEHIKANPGLTALQVSSVLVAFVPGLVVSPALAGLGMGSLGPTAGYLAPAFQTAFGTPLAFSAMQSAAMGGWGVGIVNGAVQAGAVATSIVSEAAKKRTSKL